MKKFTPNPNGGLPVEEPTPSSLVGVLTSSHGELPEPYDIDAVLEASDQAFAKRHELDKNLIECLLGLGFQILIGGNRPSLPIANLPARYAKAYEEVIGELKSRDPIENGYRSWALGGMAYLPLDGEKE